MTIEKKDIVWKPMIGVLLGGILLGGAVGVFILSPYLEKSRAKKTLAANQKLAALKKK